MHFHQLSAMSQLTSSNRQASVRRPRLFNSFTTGSLAQVVVVTLWLNFIVIAVQAGASRVSVGADAGGNELLFSDSNSTSTLSQILARLVTLEAADSAQVSTIAQQQSSITQQQITIQSLLNTTLQQQRDVQQLCDRANPMLASNSRRM